MTVADVTIHYQSQGMGSSFLHYNAVKVHSTETVTDTTTGSIST